MVLEKQAEIVLGEETYGGMHRPERKIYGVYMKSTLETKIMLDIKEVGKNIKTNLEAKLVKRIAGKCIHEGYIQPKSIKIVKYSSGLIVNNNIEFCVLFDCMCCLPVEGMEIECTCKTITKAGIHAQVIDADGNIPITVFVARDHHHLDNRLQAIKEDSNIKVSVIGVRYELNDPYICIIAKLSDGTTTGQETNKTHKNREHI